MSGTLDKIFSELDEIADMAAEIRARTVAAARQTDLEVAILKRQNDELSDKNAAADKLVLGALEILQDGAK